jgi:ATP-dependent DNA ligase
VSGGVRLALASEQPNALDWIHDIKHDGYRLIVQREDKRVRLITRNGHDWSSRYPRIVRSFLPTPEIHSGRVGSLIVNYAD